MTKRSSIKPLLNDQSIREYINIKTIPTGRFHGVSQIFTKPERRTKYSGASLRKLRADKGIGNVKSLKG